MPINFGQPREAAGNRELVAQRLKELRDGSGVPETLTIEWRGKPTHVEVIDMPVETLRYNPGTHRIRAQRAYDPARDRVLEKDPWSEESQDYLHYLLKALPADPSKVDKAFDDLTESLREYQQNEPGLITREGILVNGNTRRAALKDIGRPSMRVGVLPESCEWSDIHAVELSLQLRPDTRRDYSYINHLLALEEQVKLGTSMAEIARSFHTTTPACDRDLWVLAQLRELLSRSVTGDISLRLMDFEDAKERFFELYRAYNTERARNQERADLMKEGRLAAIVLEFAKTDVRYIQPDFHDRFLDQRLPAELRPSPVQEKTAVAIPGLGRTVQASGPRVSAAKALTDSFLRARAVKAAGSAARPEEQAAAAELFESARKVFDEALEFAGKDARLRKKRLAAPDRVTDACKDLEQCVTDLVLARGNGSLDEGAFDDALLQMRSVMRRVAVEAGKSVLLPGGGLTWLNEAVGKNQ
ncbi:ParB N-terminal domain-containing protein [Actinomadura harenae]|uniref:Transcriptional regulator n=1 Tax=Actinomadura harenae TaxID=2483351 RepID=A0A3M2M095_9ACTN|nr:transcriptional regulator [Actinomadura harenae]RMI42530.1 transcriptional regulator [Actinomadura harenae]